MKSCIWFLLLNFCSFIGTSLAAYYETDPYSHSANISVSGGDQLSDNELSSIDTKEVQKSMKSAHIQMKDDEEYFKKLANEYGIRMNQNASGFLRFTGTIEGTIANKYHSSSIMLKGLYNILDNKRHCYSYSAREFMKLLYKRNYSVHGICEVTSNPNDCEKCKRGGCIYRSYDGSCNNLKFPTWGQTLTNYERLAFPSYSDGIHKPPLSVLGIALPSARKISVRMFPSDVKPDRSLSLAASKFAQVLTHDFALQMTDNIEGGPILCCANSGSFELPKYLQHRSCMPINIADDDPWYSKYDQRCMPFVRSITGPRSDCKLGPAEQMCGVSHYLDCSFMYGSDESLAKSLRTFSGGRLLDSSRPNDPHMLPLTDSNSCDATSANATCYRAGDRRVNQNAHLVAMQVVFNREHNRIADILKSVNPHWDDEKIFQETRRVVIAIYQHIIYQEYLPLILGQSFIDELFASRDQNGFTTNYDENVSAATLNSMTIVFRGFHATIPSNIQMCTENCKVLSSHKLSDYFSRPEVMDHKYDNVINSLSCSAMIKMGTSVTKEITDKLLKSHNPYGLDQMAFDIQRGRDHGIPSYNEFRKICGLKPAITFKNLIPIMGENAVNKLQKCYYDVNDIDLIVGGMYETFMEGTQFGPVFTCIIKQQFRNWMAGDRYFYTNKNQSYPFTKDQLKEIRKSKFAKLMCVNGNNIQIIQPRAFELESVSNTRTECKNLESMNFGSWKEIISN